MKKYVVYQIDAFTKTKFEGNPAGVVVNADGLSERQMQTIARELNNSETAFLLPPDETGCDAIIRYFTPTVEVPICGHATIAAMYTKALEEGIGNCILKVKTRIGILPFEICRSDDTIKVWMTQGKIEIGPPLPQDIQARLVEYLGLLPEELDARCPIQIASTGHAKVMIGITSRAKLNKLNPDLYQLKALSNIIGCTGYFVFTLNLDDPEIISHGRMFAPAIGITEDPVTGNANGPLGAYLLHNRVVDTESDTFAFKGAQGEAIGRYGVVEVAVSVQDRYPILVKIGGEAVVVFKTFIEL